MNAVTIEHDPETINQIGPGPASIRLQFTQIGEVLPGLDAAVHWLIEAAVREPSSGILVTRHSPGDYTVALDHSVRFGETVTRIIG